MHYLFFFNFFFFSFLMQTFVAVFPKIFHSNPSVGKKSISSNGSRSERSRNTKRLRSCPLSGNSINGYGNKTTKATATRKRKRNANTTTTTATTSLVRNLGTSRVRNLGTSLVQNHRDATLRVVVAVAGITRHKNKKVAAATTRATTTTTRPWSIPV